RLAWQNSVFTKSTKISRAWWRAPVIPALGEAEVGGSPEVRNSRPAWPTRWNPISTKNTKINRAQWLMPVMPPPWEAEAGRSPELRSSRPAWSTWRDPVSTKSTKLGGCSGGHL
uniref:Uncharacterized protein n=1 Tax=Theropithecus gelada TaxID=9565 RepID=A0A8D2EE11_THEGE